jgi:hypothetical protein
MSRASLESFMYPSVVEEETRTASVKPAAASSDTESEVW